MSYQVQRVALLTSTFLPTLGGVEVGIHNIASRLIARGITPVVIAPWSSRAASKTYSLPYKVVTLPPRFFSGYKVAPKWISDIFYLIVFALMHFYYRFDFWHVTMGYPAGSAFFPAAKFLKIRHLIRCAGSDIQIEREIGYGERLDPRVDALVRRRLPQCPNLISISNSVRAEYAEIGVPTHSIIDIPNGVDTGRFVNRQHFRKEIRRLLNIKDTTPLLFCVGRNHPKKNFQAIPEIVRALKSEYRGEFHFLLVGPGVRIFQPSPNSDIAHLLTCLEPHDLPTFDSDNKLDIPDQSIIACYMGADAFVFPSLVETFGIVLVEAMAAKLPIICGNVPGCRDLVIQDKNGLLCDPMDPKSFALAVAKVLVDPEFAARLSKNSAEIAQKFDWNQVVDKYLNVYRGTSLLR